jgi:CubicO group peptidase (beta-lactamase class C family)
MGRIARFGMITGFAMVLAVVLQGMALPGRVAASGRGDDARNIECGLVAPDFKAPLRIFSPAYYATQKTACLGDRMAFYKVPGVTMALIDGNRVAWSRGYGVLETGTGRAVTPESVFEAASATKMLTAVLVLRLVERGTLDLDRDVNQYLTSWKVPSGQAGATQPVTLRLLLAHQAGVNRPVKGLPFDDGHPPTLAQVLAGSPPATNQGVVVERAPGSGHAYSNIGYLVIQQVLQDATGKSYEQLARELVFQPLGMTSSTLAHPLTAEWRARWGVPHDEAGVARPRSLMPRAVAHGGLVTSATDLATLAAEIALAWQGRSTRVLSKRSASLMLNRAADIDMGFGAPVGQGLGVMLLGHGSSLHFLHPGGNDPGANCWVIASPVTGKGVVVMTNAAAGEALMLEIVASVAHAGGWPDLLQPSAR